MPTADFLARLAAAKIVPVIRAATAERAAVAADWLAEAGFPVLEFTLTTPGALELMRANAGKAQLCVGVGTVLTAADASAALAAGAAFLVTPCWIDGVIECAAEAGRPALIGAATPAEIWRAHQAGATVVKLFPAGSLGGPGFLKSVRAVFPNLPLMPTGGVKPDNFADYLAAGALCVGMGSELAPEALIASGGRADVIALGRRLLRQAQGNPA